MIRHRSLLVLLVLASLAACGTGDDGVVSPDLQPSAATGEAHIVVLDVAPRPDRAEANRAAAADVARAYGLTANRTYGAAIVGFAAHVPAGRIAALERDPRVAYVERDDPVTLFAQTTPTGVRRIFAEHNASLDIDGIDDLRVDVDVAVIDTGVDLEHPDLNVAGGVDCTVASGGGPPWARTYVCSETEGTGGDDDHYHGTHVAGTIGALDDGQGVVGVAPGARIWAVKVLDSAGSGYESGIVAGIDWIAAHGGIEVANMSLGGAGYSQAEYDAIQGAVNVGVAFAVAAGNSGADASGYSPAAFDNVLTVSAVADFDGEPGGLAAPTCRDDVDDTLADFSNWGPAVQIAAPGVCILSTYPLEQGGYGTISGTSMASPHAAGALAILASTAADPGLTAKEVVLALYDQVILAGNVDWLDDSGDLLHEPLLDATTFVASTIAGGGGAGGGSETDAAPVVTITTPSEGDTFTTGTSIEFVGSASDEDGVLTDSLSWTSDVDGDLLVTGSNVDAVLTDGTHVVTAAATDSSGQTGTSSVTITVGGTVEAGGITLSASAYKVKGMQTADLIWSGANGDTVVVYRGDAPTEPTTDNDGQYTDTTGSKGGGSASYQVCEAGTTTCSNTVTVTW